MTPRLLLVEDDAVSRAFLTAAAEPLPAVVDAADSLSAALSLATSGDYALWLIDAHLPDGPGTALLSALHARGLRTPALAHTASHRQQDLDALVAAGFVAAVSKPLSADAWRAALQRALGAAEAMPAPPAVVAPAWDDAAALAAMNGNTAHVAALRGLFLSELPDTRAAIEAAFAADDHNALAAVLHKLRASCGFVGATRLDMAAARLREAPGSPILREAFLAALQDTLSS